MYVKTVGRPNNIFLNMGSKGLLGNLERLGPSWSPKLYKIFYKAWWLNVQSGHNKCKRIWVCMSCAVGSSAILKRYQTEDQQVITSISNNENPDGR
jgi:hypothetical protein